MKEREKVMIYGGAIYANERDGVVTFEHLDLDNDEYKCSTTPMPISESLPLGERLLKLTRFDIDSFMLGKDEKCIVLKS